MVVAAAAAKTSAYTFIYARVLAGFSSACVRNIRARWYTIYKEPDRRQVINIWIVTGLMEKVKEKKNKTVALRRAQPSRGRKHRGYCRIRVRPAAVPRGLQGASLRSFRIVFACGLFGYAATVRRPQDRKSAASGSGSRASGVRHYFCFFFFFRG